MVADDPPGSRPQRFAASFMDEPPPATGGGNVLCDGAKIRPKVCTITFNLSRISLPADLETTGCIPWQFTPETTGFVLFRISRHMEKTCRVPYPFRRARRIKKLDILIPTRYLL